MRIMSPPKFIMNISLIMRLIIALIVFQCNEDRLSGDCSPTPIGIPRTWRAPKNRLWYLPEKIGFPGWCVESVGRTTRAPVSGKVMVSYMKS